jgi:Flp pilus assembly protein TadD
LGELLRDMDKIDEAREEFHKARKQWEKLTELAPEPEYLHNLGWLLTTAADPEVRDAAKALTVATAAKDRTTQSATYWNGVGVAHYRLENWQESIHALTEAERLRADGHCLDWFFLAMACSKSGENDKARNYFDRAIEWMQKNSPNNTDLQRIRLEAKTCVEL